VKRFKLNDHDEMEAQSNAAEQLQLPRADIETPRFEVVSRGQRWTIELRVEGDSYDALIAVHGILIDAAMPAGQ
jgi:hypothetical protein